MQWPVLTFEDPRWLALLIPLLPAVWMVGRGALAGLGRTRAVVAGLLRCAVITCVVFALAKAKLDLRSESIAVAYLLDQSDSIPAERREAMLAFVNRSVAEHRRVEQDDQVAVVAFGRDAQVEFPAAPVSPRLRRIESPVDGSATDVAGAVQRAASLLPADLPRRLVVVTDGNENVGGVLRQARAAADAGVGVDVVPAPADSRQDVSVQQVAAPAAVSRDLPFDVRVVMENRGPDSGVVDGRLRVVRKAGGVEETVLEQRVSLPPGKSVFQFRQQEPTPDFYVYEARFVPDGSGRDRFVGNNRASGFVDVAGQGRVLLIEDFQHPGEFAALVDSLRRSALEVEVRPSDDAFASMAELLRYDVVLLANVSRTNDSQEAGYASLSEDQVEMLVRNTRDFGAGLVMLGGARAFGAGGWAGSPLEEAMPVDFRIKNKKVIPVGALALVIDKSGSMQGEKLRLSTAAARAAIGMLGPRDMITVVAFDGQPYVVTPMSRVGDGRRAMADVSRLAAGGGTDLYPGMDRAYQAIRRAEASVKHMIVLTDGQTPSAGFVDLAAKARSENITVTGVAVGPDADRKLLARIAAAGGGKFYAVSNPRAVPRIFMHEARRVAMPVIRRLDPPLPPQVITRGAMLKGIDEVFPPVAGFVQTTVKDSPLVEVLLRSPEPADPRNATLLASWNYGLGRAVALTTDAGQDWSREWTGWPGYDRFYAHLVRTAMRPSGGDSRFVVSTDVENGHTRVTVNAIDDQQEFVNNLGLSGVAVASNGEASPLTLSQAAPGRYVGRFASPEPGTFFISLHSSDGGAIRAGVSVPSGDEYATFQTNLPLLRRLASTKPRGGQPGRLAAVGDSLPFATPEGDLAALELDPFRRDLPPVPRPQDAWPLLVLAGSVLFFGDVLVRRLHLDFAPLAALALLLRPRHRAETDNATMARLKSRKRRLRQEHRGSDLQFSLADATAAETHPGGRVADASEPASAAPDADSYTSRLLAAKRAASRSARSGDDPE